MKTLKYLNKLLQRIDEKINKNRRSQFNKKKLEDDYQKSIGYKHRIQKANRVWDNK